MLQFINPTPDLQLQKISSYPGLTLSKGNAPSNSLARRYGQKHLTISSLDLTLISNISTKITDSLACWCNVTNGICLTHLMLSIHSVFYHVIFSLCSAKY